MAAKNAPSEIPPAPLVSPGSAALLVALGLLSALLSAFLWGELLVVRAGGQAFCAAGDATACVALWDSPFASSVHRLTGVPVAGWGLVWSLVAALLPLVVLKRAAERAGGEVWRTAVRLHAAAGLVVVFVLAAVSLAAKVLCVGCLGAYLLVGGYAGIALFGWSRAGIPALSGALARVGAGLLVAFLLLLYPGQRTPRSLAAAGQDAILAAPRAPSATPSLAPSAPESEADLRVRQFVASLDPQLQQGLSDSLAIYRRSRVPAMRPPGPRALFGSPAAPVRITEFTDVLCTHCATLHQTMQTLRQSLPAGSFSVDSRHFPLDGRCNGRLRPATGEDTRCVASAARICLEGVPGAEEFASALFQNQASLTRDKVLALAAPHQRKAALLACIASPDTREKLAGDVAYAGAYDPDGTPLVLVNGRQGTSFGPFLFAMVLTQGRDDHPAFAVLPAPNPQAHMH